MCPETLQGETVSTLNQSPRIIGTVYKVNVIHCSELVVPLFQQEKNEPCTALLDLDSWTWSKLPHYGPYDIDANTQFFTISDEAKKHVFILGGAVRDRDGIAVHYNYRVQRLDPGSGWRKLDANISLPIQHQPPVIPLNFYWENNWPHFNIMNFPPKGETFSTH